MSTSTKMTAAAILDLAHGPAETVELFPGYQVPVRGASASEWVAYVVRPNPTVRATFTMGATDELAAAQGIERSDKFDIESYLNDNIDGGPEVKACIGAVFMGHPGDETIKRLFMSLPSDKLDVNPRS